MSKQPDYPNGRPSLKPTEPWPWSRYTNPIREENGMGNGYRPDCYPGSKTSETSGRVEGTHFPKREYTTDEYLTSFNANRTPPSDDRPGGWVHIAGGERYAPYDKYKHPKRWQK